VTPNADDGLVIEPADAASAESIALVDAYLAEINAGFGHVPDERDPNKPADFTPPKGSFLVVRDERGAAIGCAAVRLLDPETAEVKRMWLDTPIRGRGMGRRLLAAIEQAAIDLGATRAVLDTHESLTSAVSLYERSGWTRVPRYNANVQATHWFAKDLKG
jgi:GNAT superfamily N-acetyltransferase